MKKMVLFFYAFLFLCPLFAYADDLPAIDPIASSTPPLEATTTPEIASTTEPTLPPDPPPVTITFDIETASTTVFKNSLTVSACPITLGSATTSVNGFCALEQSGLPVTWSWFGDDAFIDSIGGVANDFGTNAFWLWFSDIELGSVALNKHELHSGENILVTIGRLPMQVRAATSSPIINATTTIAVTHFAFDASFSPVWLPAASSTVFVNDAAYTPDGNGILELIATSTYPISIYATENGFIASDTILLTPFEETATSTPEIPPTETPPPAPGGGGSAPNETRIDIARAFAYLASAQKENGSFGSDLLSDWAALAYASIDTPSPAKDKLRKYLRNAVPTIGNTTDAERHAMALLALGINPYNGTPTDYIQKITAAFDGTQIGDAHLVNDDIFALFPLLSAGYNTSDALINKTVSFILAEQEPSGLWDSIDLTAAAIQALTPLKSLAGVEPSITRAREFLQLHQSDNGGFGSSFSTGWTLQAIKSLNEHPTDWKKSGRSPNDYLALLQATDGGIESPETPEQTRVWATVYAIPGSLEKPWPTLLQTFPKPASSVTVSAGGSFAAPASTTPTTTPPVVLGTTTSSFANTPLLTTTTSLATMATTLPVVLPVTQTKKQTAATKNNFVPTNPPIPEKASASKTPPENQPASVAQNNGFVQQWLGNFVQKISYFFRALFH